MLRRHQLHQSMKITLEYLFSAWAAFFTEIEHLDQLGWDSAPGVGHRTYVLVPIWKALDVIFPYWHLTGHGGMLLGGLIGPQVLQILQ
jgi:hypothetical protein